MTDEKVFDNENYIQEQLRRIDDLDERRFAKQLLTEFSEYRCMGNIGVDK
ncbi:MAG: hypothetical protein K2O15_11585 [Lachnospiraceae bacterium]|nr:hypothetical protein [Lachnospiraceae bacterium]